MYVSDDNQPPGMIPWSSDKGTGKPYTWQLCMHAFILTPQAYRMNLCCGNRVTCTAY